MKLVYVKPICKDGDEYVYDFLFSETPDIVWGKDWDYNYPNLCDDLTPDSTTYSSVERVKTSLPLKTIEETSCYSMEYAINGSVALAWIDIENLESYPENGRMVFHFGDNITKVEELLKAYNYYFINKEK